MLTAAEVRHVVFLIPGTPTEAAATIPGSSSATEKESRRAAAGQGWTYRIVVPPQTRCRLEFEVDGTPAVRVTTANDQTVASQIEKTGASYVLAATAPASLPLGGTLHFQFNAGGSPIAVRQVKLILQLPDRNGDGLSDSLEQIMGLNPDQRADLIPRPALPRTSFFYAWRYDPTLAVPTDAVRLYFSTVTSDLSMYSTWADKHYDPQTMIHSRFGWEIRPCVDEVQADRNGKLSSVGDSKDYYKVPTPARTELAKKYYVGPLLAGATAVGFDEPEYWAHNGYSAAFKQEWQAHYGTPWQPPHDSVDVRYKAEQLKAFLFERHVDLILKDAQQRKPSAPRLLALHSPVNYYQWNIVAPHYGLVKLPQLHEVIAEVWTGTAQSPALAEGARAARIFEVGYLEYSSCYHLVRGTGKRLWFLMDPMEDTPGRPIADYRYGYERTLLAALMFPEVDSYEVLVWPNRIFKNVPKEYSTVINTVVGALCEMWRYPHGQVEAGCASIGTFVSDSMGWQRAEPHPSDYDGFYGLALPLVLHGVPVQVLSLDRVAEPGYLDQTKTLLVSYDFLKPAHPAINVALANWTRRGGTLVFVGGSDAYNAVTESWWRRAGYASPGEDLFAQMNVSIRNPKVISGPSTDLTLQAVTNVFADLPASLKVRRAYPVSLYTPPAAARSLYRIEDEPLSAVWEVPVGKGTAVFVGIAPGFLSATAESSQWLRTLTRHACARAGVSYREQPYFLVRRGPYTGISALDTECRAPGRFVDLLSPSLQILENPTIAAHGCAFLSKADSPMDQPRLWAVSGRLRAQSEQAELTSFLIQAPAQTDGAARAWSGQRAVKEAKAFTVLGAEVPITWTKEADTVLFRYPNDPDGVVVRVNWEAAKGL